MAHDGFRSRNRITTAEGRTDSDILLLRSEDRFCASGVSYRSDLVEWASGGQPTPLGVLVSIPTWYRMMLHVLSGPGVTRVLERMAAAAQTNFLDAPEHTRVSGASTRGFCYRPTEYFVNAPPAWAIEFGPSAA
jgi:hypothetical protein